MKEDTLCVIAFLFDTFKAGGNAYGEAIFEQLIKGGELSNNGVKVIVSDGDVLDKNIYDDIRPFITRDELCTVNVEHDKCKDRIYAVMIEDIYTHTAKRLDERLMREFPAYLGMTSIDIASTDSRKQFWKMLIRRCSIEAETFTCFGYEESGSIFERTAKDYGLRVNYDSFPDEWDCDNQAALFSTRQSSFIRNLKQLEPKEGPNDSDRGRSEMNFSLVKEVEIAGVLIWKSIEDINRVHIPKVKEYVITDYIFTSLYQASQGIERLLKILIELIAYDNTSLDREKIDALLLSHKHVAMYNFIDKHIPLQFRKNERKLLELLDKFYNGGRYNRYSYSDDDIMELKLLQDFGNDLKEEGFDRSIKRKYGRAVGSVSRKVYDAISHTSSKLRIYVDELNSDSPACFVFILNKYDNDDLYRTLDEIENSKRELIWYLMKKGNTLPIVQCGGDIDALPFDDVNVRKLIDDLIRGTNSGVMIHDFVSNEYDEMIRENKELWKTRKDFIKLI